VSSSFSASPTDRRASLKEFFGVGKKEVDDGKLGDGGESEIVFRKVDLSGARKEKDVGHED
jgi:hypothetical protein